MFFHSVLVTGANRGIGLQFVKDFLKLGNNKIGNVIATYRNPNDPSMNDLKELEQANENLSLLELDVKNYASFNDFRDKLRGIVGDKGLSLLINNAGIAVMTTLETVTPEKMIENFEVNAVSPLLLSKALLPLLQKSSKSGNRTVIAHISSKLGSIEDNISGGFYAYRTSKSAMNQIGKSMSVDLKKDKIEVAMLHPGWVSYG